MRIADDGASANSEAEASVGANRSQYPRGPLAWSLARTTMGARSSEMPADSSFDIVSKLDRQEVDNAL
ncbi:MAG TPA: hypothetical protein VHZ03_09425, partial [Trebonia sp.]|nr:hypothetical protein [Trebonia sp.]